MNSERHPITERCYPSKTTVEEFLKTITEFKEAFAANMGCLEDVPEELYPEEWLELYAEWLELKKPADDYWRKSGARVKNSPTR